MIKSTSLKKKIIVSFLTSCSFATIAASTQTYNVTVATDTPSSPSIGTPGAGGSGYDLRGAILTANASNNTTFIINFIFGSATTITLVNHLPMISNYNGTSATAAPINKTWTFNGNGNVTLDGASLYRGFFFSPVPAATTQSDLPTSGYAQQLNVSVKNMVIQNVLAKGGNAGNTGAGGGGMGAGGAGFLNSYSNITYDAVTFENCKAQGGNGGGNGLSGSGGGGMGGNGGLSSGSPGSGGGGLGGNGGNNFYSGGGGIGGDGGLVSGGAGGGGGGFGGTGIGQVLSSVSFGSAGSGVSGGAGGAKGGGGGAGGIANAGASSTATGKGGDSTAGSSAGGGGGINGISGSGTTGGNGGLGGGGGGAGTSGVGGIGGFGGGGGSGLNAKGGFGGGGGSGSGTAGDGGFGGGAGIGNGGFGGGAGAAISGTSGGFGAGNASGFGSGGGGGAGLGGALFVRNGGTLLINGPTSFGQTTLNSVGGGTGYSGGGNGSGIGQDLFVMGTSSSATNVTLDSTNGNITFNGSIADDNGNSSSLGAKLIIQGSNKVILNASSPYIGGTNVTSGTVAIGNNSALGAGSLSLGAGTTLQALTTLSNVANNITLSGNATIDTQAYNLTNSGIISSTGAYGITKLSSGILTLSGTNTYTGSTNIQQGTLSVSNASALGNGGTVTLGTATTAGILKFSAAYTVTNPLSLSTAQTSTLDLNGNNITLSGSISAGGSTFSLINSAGTAKNLNLSTANTYSGTTSIDSYVTLALSSNGTIGTSGLSFITATSIFDMSGITPTSLTIGDLNSAQGQVNLGSKNLTFGGTSTTANFAGVIQDGGISGGTGGSITKTSTGTATLSGTNTYTGGTTVSGGTLAFNNYQALGTGAVRLGAGTILQLAGNIGPVNPLANAISLTGNSTIDNNGYTGYFTNPLTGAYALTVQGSGMLVIGGANTPSSTIINSGTLALNTGASLANTVTINSGATYDISKGAANPTLANITAAAGSTIQLGNQNPSLSSGTIAGNLLDGGLSGFTGAVVTKTGAGTLTLSGVNTYSGGTTLSAGTLAVSADSNMGNSSGSLTFSGGTLQALASFTSARSGSVTSAGTIDTNGNNVTLSGAFSGAGILTKAGLGTLTLSGNNTYTGGTTLSAGTLAVSAENNMGNSSGNLTFSGGTLQAVGSFASTRSGSFTAASTIDTNGNNVTLSGAFSGAGILTKAGLGTLTLSGNSTYSGGTTLSAGTLAVSAENNMGNSSGNLTFSGGTLQALASFTSARSGSVTSAGTINTNGNTVTLSGAFSGAGILTKAGLGTLTLSGNSTYSGGTTLSAGTLAVSADSNMGDSSGNLTFSGGTLQAVGSFTSTRSGSVTAASTIDTNGNNVTLSGAFSGAGILTKAGLGTLTLSGNNTYSSGTTLTAGILSLAHNSGAGTGAIAYNGGSLQAGLEGLSLANAVTLQNNVSNGVNLNGFNTTLAGVIGGGNSSSTFAVTNSGGTAKTLTLSGINTYTGNTSIGSNVTVAIINAGTLGTSGLSFTDNTSTFDISGMTPASLTMGDLDSTQGKINLGAKNLTFGGTSTTANFAGVIEGAGGTLTKAGSGTARLSGANTYTGGTTLSTGTLAVSTDSNMGDSSGSLTFSGGTLQALASFTSTRSGSVTSAGTINTNGNTVSLSGAFSGAGILTKAGLGTLTLSGNSTYSGGTTLTAGILSLAHNSGAGTGAIAYNGGSLLVGLEGVNLANDLTLQNSVSNGLNLNGFNATWSGAIAGGNSSSTFAVTNSGTTAKTLTLSGINTYTGNTSIGSNVTVAIINAGTLGTSGLSFTDNTSTFDISGMTPASLTMGDLDSTQGKINLGAKNLTFGGTSTTANFAGVIEGAGGTLTKAGSGTARLSGANTYTGGTTLSAGTLAVSADSNMGDSSGSLTFSGGTLQALASFTSARSGSVTSAGTINTNGNTVTLSGAFSGAGILTKAGLGTLTLSGNSTYSGGTTLSAGTLAVSADSNMGDSSGNLTFSGGTLQAVGSFTSTRSGSVTAASTIDTNGNNVTLSGAFSGAGILTKAGLGTLTLSGNNTYSSGTTLTAGILSLAHNSGAGTGAIAYNGGSLQAGLEGLSLANAVTLQNNVSNGVNLNGFNATLAGVIGGGNSSSTFAVTNSGGTAKTLTLSGINTYTGNTSIGSNVTVAIINAGTLGTSGLSFTDNTSTFDISGMTPASLTMGDLDSPQGRINLGAKNLTFGTASTTANFAGVIEGADGTLTKAGNGTARLSGANTYTGGTTLSAGTLAVSADSNMGDSSGSLTFSGGTLQALASFTSTRSGSITAASTIDTNGNTVTLSGAFSGAGILTKAGLGTLTLSGNSTYSSGTILTAGILSLAHNSGAGTGAIAYNGGSLQAGLEGLSLANAVTLQNNVSNGVNLDGFNATLAGVIGGGNGSSTFAVTNSGGTAKTLTLSGTNTYTGTTSIGSKVTVALSGASTLGTGNPSFTDTTSILDISTTNLGATFNNLASATGTIALGAKPLTLNNTANTSFGGTISDDSLGGSVTKTGTGTLSLSGTNTHTGGTIINDGKLNISNHLSLGTSSLEFNGVTPTLQIGAALSGAIPNDIILTTDGYLDTQGYNVTLAGSITGAPTTILYKLGTGILRLSGANSFDRTVHQDGTIAVDDNQGLGTGAFTFSSANTVLQMAAPLSDVTNDVTLNANGIINTAGNNAKFSGVFNGTGSLTKTGAGILELSNANNLYAGPTLVNGGELKVNGSLTSSDVTVANGARLTGNATVYSLTNVGAVKPGNSIGTIIVTTDFNNTGGTYNCEIDANQNSDLIRVLGTATLGGTVYVLPQPGDYSTAKTYTILEAPNYDIIGTFNTVASLSPLLKYTPTYLARSVRLTAIQGSSVSDIITEGNPGIIADYLDTLNPPAGSPLKDLQNVLPTLSLEDLYKAINQLQPAANVLINSTVAANELNQIDGIFSSLLVERSLRKVKKHLTADETQAAQLGFAIAQANTPFHPAGLGGLFFKKTPRAYTAGQPHFPQSQAAPENIRASFGQLTLWMQQAASYVNQRSVRDGSPTIGSPGVKAPVHGTSVGADAQVTDQLLVGTSLGYTKTSYHLRQRYGNGKVSSYRGGLYGLLTSERWHIKAAGFYGRHDFKGKRNLTLPTLTYTNRQNHRGHHLSGLIEVGRDMTLANKAILTPYGSFGGLSLKENGYTETAHGFNPSLRVNGRRSRFIQAKGGVQLSSLFTLKEIQLYVYGKLGYIYKKPLGRPQRITANFNGYDSSFTVCVNNKQQNMVNPGLGVTALLNNKLSLSASYTGEISPAQRLHQALIRVDYRF